VSQNIEEVNLHEYHEIKHSFKYPQYSQFVASQSRWLSLVEQTTQHTENSEENKQLQTRNKQWVIENIPRFLGEVPLPSLHRSTACLMMTFFPSFIYSKGVSPQNNTVIL
jgi:hypothetical protein